MNALLLLLLWLFLLLFGTLLNVCVYPHHIARALSYLPIQGVQTWRRRPALVPGIIPPSNVLNRSIIPCGSARLGWPHLRRWSVLSLWGCVPPPPAPRASPTLSSSTVVSCGGGLRRGPSPPTDAHAATWSAVVAPCDAGHFRRRSHRDQPWLTAWSCTLVTHTEVNNLEQNKRLGGGGGDGADVMHNACVCPYAQAACN